MKITLLGAAGGIGQPLALLLKTQLPVGSCLRLYDVARSTPGVAVDISSIPTRVKTVGFSGNKVSAALEGSDVVILVAGMARKPGMTRAELLEKNAGIVSLLTKEFAQTCPDACLAIVTNPVNTTVPLAARILQAQGCYNPRKLFGVTTLDVLRARCLMAERRGFDPELVDVPVIGGHSETTILPLFSKVPCLPEQVFSREDAIEFTDLVRRGGTLVVEAKAGCGSATLSMASAASAFILTLLRGLEGEPDAIASTYVGNPASPTPFFGQQVRFGKDGIEEYLAYDPISEYEQEELDAIVPVLRQDIEKAYELELE